MIQPKRLKNKEAINDFLCTKEGRSYTAHQISKSTGISKEFVVHCLVDLIENPISLRITRKESFNDNRYWAGKGKDLRGPKLPESHSNCKHIRRKSIEMAQQDWRGYNAAMRDLEAAERRRDKELAAEIQQKGATK